MQLINKLSYNKKILLLQSIVIPVIFIILGFFLYREHIHNIVTERDRHMIQHVSELADIVQLYSHTGQREQTGKKKSPAEIAQIIQNVINTNVDGIMTSDSLPLSAEYVIENSVLEEIIADNQSGSAATDSTGLRALREVFYSKKYYKTGYPYFVSEDGIMLIHPTAEGQNVIQSVYFRQMENSDRGEGVFRYRWPDDDTGKIKMQYFKYVDTANAFVAISFYEEEMYVGLTRLWVIYAIGLLAILIVSYLIVFIATRDMNKMVGKITKTLRRMAKGNLVQPVIYNKNNEIGRIIEPLNVLIDGLRSASDFSNEITNNNLEVKYTPLSDNDVLGNSLLEMRQSLINAKAEEKERKKEDDKQKWASNGLAKFSDILRHDNDDLNKLTYRIISNLVKYLDANQGGIFIINDDNPKDIFFELKSAFAYDKQKFISKRIDAGVGVVGRCIQEKETVFMTELPDDYIHITSGLGEATPNCLLTVPLIMNEEIFGAIEIASFNEFEAHQIEFVEKIAETIASTISIVKINVRTARLLGESEKQAKKLEKQEEEMRQNLEELRATQEEAAKNEEAAMGFVNAVNHTIIRADYNLDGTIKYVNTKLLDIMGYTVNEIKDQHYSMFVQEKDLPSFNKAWRRLSEGGKHYEEEVEYKTKHGKIWLLATYTAVRDRKGKVVKILYLAIDISKEKRKNLAYENDIKAINSSIFKIEYDTDSRIIHENAIVNKALGYKPDERTGKKLFELIDTDQLDAIKAVWTQVLNKIPVQRQEKIRTKDGKIKWFNGTYTPVLDQQDRLVKVLYTANDITEQKQLEIETQIRNKALEEQEQKLTENMNELNETQEKMRKSQIEMQGLLQAIDASIFAVEHDLNGEITKVNDAYNKQYGVNPNDYIGKNDKEFADLSTPEKLEEYKQFWDEIKFGVIKQKVRKLNINNREVWMSETYTPILDENKKPYKILKLSIDITKTKELEIEANQKKDELQAQEEELRQNLEELQATQEDLEHKMQENERIQADLAKEKYLLDSLLDTIPDAIYYKDRESRFLRVSKSMFNKFDVSSNEEILGKTDFDFFTGEHAQQAYNDEQKIIRTKKPIIDFVEKETFDDGSVKWVSTTKMPLFNEKNEVVGTFGISRDITKIKEMEIKMREQNEALQTQEEELRQNLEELQATQEDLENKMTENDKINKALAKEKYLMDALLDNIPDAIYFKDKESRFLRISSSMVSKFGVQKPEDLYGKTDFDFFGKEHAQQAYNDEQEIIRTNKPIIDLVEKETFDDGSVTWVSTTKMPLTNDKGEVVGTFGISRDITKIKQMEIEMREKNDSLQTQEEELRQNLEELQATQENLEAKMKENEKMQQELAKEKNLLDAMLDNIPDYIYFKDKECKFLRISQSMVKLFKANSADELIGKSDFDFHGQAHANKAFNEEQRIMSTGTAMIDEIVKETWDDGREHWVSTTKMPLRDKKGEVVGLFGISKDVTPLKNMELQMREQNESLQTQEEELRQNLEELQATQENLEAKMKENEEMQQELAKEKNLLDAMLDNIPDYIYFKDKECKFLRISESMVKLFKANSADELIGKSDFDFHGQAHANKAFNEEQRIMSTGTAIIDEIVKETWDDGREHWVSTTKMPLRNKEGEVVGLFGISKDVTPLKNMEMQMREQNEALQTQEEELRQNLEELQATQENLETKIKENDEIQQELAKEKNLLDAMLDNIPDYIYFKDKECKFIRISQSMVKLFKANSSKDLVGKSDFDFHTGEHAKKAFNEEQRIMSSGTSMIDEIVKETWDDGREHWVSTTKMPLRDEKGEVVGLFGISKDVTKLKELELEATHKNEALQNKEKELTQKLNELETMHSKLEQIKAEDEKRNKEMMTTIENHQRMLMKVIDNIPGRIMLKDAKGKLLLVNNEVSRLHGMSAEEILGKNDFDLYPREIAQKYWDDEQAIKTGGLKTYVQKEKIGEEQRTLRTTKMPFFIAHKNETGILSIQTDITELKRLQEETKLRNDELEAQSEELRQNLEELQATQEEMERVKEEEARKTKEMLETIEAHQKTLIQVLDKLPGRICLKDKNGKFILANHDLAALFNTSVEKLIGTKEIEYYDKEEATKITKQEKNILQTEKTQTYIKTIDTNNKGHQYMKTTKMPFFIEYMNQTGILEFQLDVTDIKKMEIEVSKRNTELQETQKELAWEKVMFDTLMNYLPDRITFKDSEGRFKRVNKAKAEKFNLKSPEDAIDKTDFDFFAKEHAEKALNEEKKLMKSGKPLYDTEEKLVWNDGRITWASTSRIPFADGKGNTIGSLIISRDITEHKLLVAKQWKHEQIISGIAGKLPVIVYNTDFQGKIVDLFGKGIQKLEAGKKEYLNRNIFEIYPKQLEKIQKGKEKQTVFKTKEKDNTILEHTVFRSEIIEEEIGYYTCEILKDK